MKLRKVKKSVKKFIKDAGLKIVATHGRTFVVSGDNPPDSLYRGIHMVVSKDYDELDYAIEIGKMPLNEWLQKYKKSQFKKRMKLQPYSYGKKDTWLPPGYFSYHEEIDDKGYFYEVYALMNTRKVRIVITESGVSIECKNSGDIIWTDIDPSRLFPDRKSLEWDDLAIILNKIDDRDHESTYSSGDEMKKMFNKWETEVKGKDITE